MGALWPRSGTVERYADDIRAAGAKAYFFNGGTTTPMSVFQDAAEGSAHPNPVVADAHGRWPDVFVPYITSYDVRVTSADNVQLTYSLQIPNPNPVDTTVVVSPDVVIQTGMVHAELVNSTKSGYVRLNGRTLGNAASAASERANADTSALFAYLWNNLSDAIASVSTGRGGSAAADYAANKNIVLPSMRGRVFVGLDDMGNAAAGNFSGLSFDAGNTTTAGSSTGGNSYALSTAQLPSHSHTATVTGTDGTHTHTTGIQSANHTHSGTTGGGSAHFHDAFIRDPQHSHTYNVSSTPASLGGGAGFSSFTASTTGSSSTGVKVNTQSNGLGTDDRTASESAHTHSFTSGNQSVDHTHSIALSGAHSHSITVGSVGSGTAINNLPMSRLVTWFIKL